MAKGYWVARVDVNNEARASSPMRRPTRRSSRNSAAATWCAAANSTAWKVPARSRNVVIEFADYATAMACYRSPEYQENIKRRLPHSTVDLIVIEGYDGPQP